MNHGGPFALAVQRGCHLTIPIIHAQGDLTSNDAHSNVEYVSILPYTTENIRGGRQIPGMARRQHRFSGKYIASRGGFVSN